MSKPKAPIQPTTGIVGAGNTNQALFTFAVLADYVAMGRSRIYGLISDIKFPAPIKVGKSSRWLKTEVDQWIEDQAHARNSMQEVAV